MTKLIQYQTTSLSDDIQHYWVKDKNIKWHNAVVDNKMFHKKGACQNKCSFECQQNGAVPLVQTEKSLAAREQTVKLGLLQCQICKQLALAGTKDKQV